MRIIVYTLIMSLLTVNFQKDNDLTLFLVADSTVSDKPFDEGGNPEKGWGQIFPLYLKEGIKVDNHAVNGRSTKSFMDQGRWDKVLSLMKPGDYVVIEFGHNDQKKEDPARYADPDSAYRANLKKYIADAKSKGAHPILATPIVRRRFDEKGQFYDTHGRYPEVVREVAEEEDVPLLDLHKQSMELVRAYGPERSKQLFLHIQPGEYASLPDGREDDTHLSPYGAFRICDLVAESLQANVPELAAYLKN
jgi:lysophospholipase L1-like esterase